VKRTGRIGRKLLKLMNPDLVDPVGECPPNKIRNITGICVNRTGKIGRELVKNLKRKNVVIKPLPQIFYQSNSPVNIGSDITPINIPFPTPSSDSSSDSLSDSSSDESEDYSPPIDPKIKVKLVI